MKGVPIDESLCAYLKEYRRGQENAASSKELEAAFHVGGTELRRAVNRLRCDGRCRLLLCGAAIRGQGHRRPAHRAHL